MATGSVRKTLGFGGDSHGAATEREAKVELRGRGTIRARSRVGCFGGATTDRYKNSHAYYSLKWDTHANLVLLMLGSNDCDAKDPPMASVISSQIINLFLELSRQHGKVVYVCALLTRFSVRHIGNLEHYEHIRRKINKNLARALGNRFINLPGCYFKQYSYRPVVSEKWGIERVHLYQYNSLARLCINHILRDLRDKKSLPSKVQVLKRIARQSQ